jgi:hypothetical protein
MKRVLFTLLAIVVVGVVVGALSMVLRRTTKATTAAAMPPSAELRADAPRAGRNVAAHTRGARVPPPPEAAFSTAGTGTPSSPDPRRVGDELVHRIRSSGPPSESWTGTALNTFVELKSVLPPETQRVISYGPLDCFRDGCVAVIEAEDHGAWRSLVTAWLESPPSLAWQAPKHWTGAVPLDSGRVSAAFIIERPKGPETKGE